MTRAKLALLAVVVALVVGYLLGLWSELAWALGGLWYLLVDSTPVPNWLLGIFALCALIVAGWLGASLRPSRASARRSPISSQDIFFNIRWRWSHGPSGRVQDLASYCLRCGERLVLKDVAANRPAARYECRCDRCGMVACEIDCSIEEFEKRVLDQIHQTSG